MPTISSPSSHIHQECMASLVLAGGVRVISGTLLPTDWNPGITSILMKAATTLGIEPGSTLSSGSGSKLGLGLGSSGSKSGSV